MLYKTTSNRRHYHVSITNIPVLEPGLILEQPVILGETSVHKNHSHQIILDVDGNVVLTEAEDGHTHELFEYELTDPKDKTDKEEDAVDRVLDLLEESREYESYSRKKGKESWEFYDGKQWPQEQKNELQKQKRACLTMNEIAPKIDLLDGFNRQNRSDTRILPVEGGDERVAEILTFLIKRIDYRNNAPMNESKQFMDQMIPGRGVSMLSMDWDRSVEGEIKDEHVRWDSIYLGPHERNDLEDLEYAIGEQRFSRAKVKEMWPEKAEDIETWVQNLHGNHRHDTDNKNGAYDARGNKLYDIAKKEIYIYTLIRKVYRPIYVADVDQGEDVQLERVSLEGVDRKDISKFEAIENVTTRKRVVHDAYTTIVGGETFLEQFKNDVNEIPVTVAYGKRKHDGGFYGKVEPVKDHQRQINKVESNKSDWTGRGAGSSKVYYQSDTFPSTTEKNNFKKHAASPWGAYEVTDINRRPVREDTPPIPVALFQERDAQSESLNKTMGIPLEAFGVNLNQDVSGIAIRESRKSGMAANEYLFDNSREARKRKAKIMIKFIAEYYTIQRINRELGSAKDDEISQQLQQLTEIEVAKLFQDRESLLNYDVVISESAESESYRLGVFVDLMEMIRSGALPPSPSIQQMMIELSPMTVEHKARAMTGIQADQQAEQAQQQQTNQTEILKSLPPELQAQAMGAGGQANPAPPPIQQGLR